MLAIVVECLLATHMSRKPLISGYGFPCPALPPGIAGARNVKWVSAKGGQWGGTRSPSQRLSFPTRCGYWSMKSKKGSHIPKTIQKW